MNNSKLEELRELHNLSKIELAKKLGVSDSIYARWEKGKDIIPTKRLYQLANIYNINIDYILGLTNKAITIKNANLDILKVAERCREIRKDYNESLREFVKKLNTSNSTWSAYENGKTLILCAFMLEISRLGNYSIDWILGLSDKKYIK